MYHPNICHDHFSCTAVTTYSPPCCDLRAFNVKGKESSRFTFLSLGPEGEETFEALILVFENFLICSVAQQVHVQ